MAVPWRDARPPPVCPHEPLQVIAMSACHRKTDAKRRLDNLIGRYVPKPLLNRNAFWRLIHVVRSRSGLLVPLRERGRTDPQDAERVLRACAYMAHRYEAWHRPPETWTAPNVGPFVQFRSLVSHLFDEYPVPNFMVSVWLRESLKRWELDLYQHLAAGKSIRQFRLPVPFPTTRRAAAFFMQAPDDLCPIEALRWGHVRALGGDNRLARLLSRTILANPTTHESFWESVVRFLVKHAPISESEIVAIIAFIHQQRFQPADIVWGPGAGQRPLQPEFTLQGRSLMSLRRHMANWRTEIAPGRGPWTPRNSTWERTDIEPFRQAQGDLIWTIDELLTDKELRVEGGIMQHCVATCISQCARRRTSIWSMKVQQGMQHKRVLTIEVVPENRTIRQARGKRNSPPSAAAKAVLRQWAHRERLNFQATA